MIAVHPSFPRYTGNNPRVPVYNLTPNLPACMHRFFDTSPISPSGRYGAFLQLPDEYRLPQPGGTAGIVLVDLEKGPESARVVYETRGWEHQMGANINWGAGDDELVFNDVDSDSWTPFGVRLNPHTGASSRFPKGVYHLSPDGKLAAVCSLEKMRRTQFGYGVVIPDDKVGPNGEMPEDDGLYIVDVESGEVRTFVSIADLHRKAAVPSSPDDFAGGWHYGFHAKWNFQGDRLIFTTRWVPAVEGREWYGHRDRGTRYSVFVLKPDGTGIHNAVPWKYWTKGGHHINWFPDGEKLSMNLGYFRHLRGEGGLDMVSVNPDGSDIGPITTAVPGSGHPSVHPDGRHILADVYAHSKAFVVDGTTPLRWIDYIEGTEEELVRFHSSPEVDDNTMRVDPHPAWTRDWRYVTFNSFIDGTRRVLLADMRELVS
ncbi:MAG: hypothetical protein R6V03_08625 [Kiritimatiellia bacterium]